MEIFNNILLTEKSKDYELLDSGEGEKLERFGSIVLRRPDPQALWGKTLNEKEWQSAGAVFKRKGTTGTWDKKEGIEDTWDFSLNDLSFSLKLLPSKHVGVFPEQSAQWSWLEEKISKAKNPSILNLFGYTGGATLACARSGAEVCHIDSSEFVVDIAKKNLKNSGLGEKSVRFIVDDVRKFVEREIKRGKKYDIILLDPPVYGKGSKKEVWNIEEDLLPLLKRIKNILSDKPIAVVLNGYASVYSSHTYENLLKSVFKGRISGGEMCIKETSGARLLSAGIFARVEF